ncbi:MAG: InlB B-repeat-containing protein [Oscillospiraceae bacterium]
MYKNIKVPVKLLNIGIIIGIVALILVTVFLALKGSFKISFEVSGGTAVEMQSLKYGKTVTPFEPPERTGYTFIGWYKDKDFTNPWIFETDIVENNMTLYAKWKKNIN